MTSLAANNILPLRIGDVMRIFTYADDLGASPSVILSTVILEKLLDIFVLVLLFVSTMGRRRHAASRLVADVALAISTVGLLVLMLGCPQPAATYTTPLRPSSRKPEACQNRTLDPLALDATAASASPALFCFSCKRSSSGPARA